MTAVLWLRRDLRIEDNRAFNRAHDLGLAAVAYIDQPDAMHTARRRKFETATLGRIAVTLRAHDIACRRVAGPPAAALIALCAETGANTVVANQLVGDAHEYAADEELRRALRSSGIRFIETPNDGLRRGHADKPKGFIDLRDDLTRHKAKQPHPFKLVLAFLYRLPGARYTQDMWRPGPDERASSRLSVHFATGALATDRVLYELSVLSDAATIRRQQSAYSALAARLTWRRSFIQDFESNMGAYPVAPTREERPEDGPRMAAWLAGETGIPMVDAAMRDLTRNGWINFRMRQIVVSCAIDLLDLDWYLVAGALGALFDDYEPGIHWPQCALAAGLLSGRGPRILNPVKQGADLDADERWVRSRLPQLAGVPDGLAHSPWRHDAVRFAPIVDPVAAARTARARYPASPENGV